MADLLLKNHAPDGQGLVHRVTPESAGWGHVGFELYRLEPGQGLEASTGGREACLVLVGGKARVRAGSRDFGEIGERMGPFEGKKPVAVYVPWQSDVPGRGDDRSRARRLLGAGRRRPRGPPDRPGPGRLLGARHGQQHAPRLRHPARDRARAFAARGRGDHARGRLVVLPEPQARHRQPAGRIASCRRPTTTG